MLKRQAVEAIDKRLGEAFPVLDHGFIRIVDYMGGDESVVQAARVSYGSGTKSLREDRGLIRYLMRHRHTTPFEMCEIKLHVKLPVFVARQWIRHRTANVNEYSARYSILDSEFYVPNVADIQPQSKTNRQGRDGALPERVRWAMLETIRQHSEGSYQLYDELRTGWPWIDSDGELVPNVGGDGQFDPGPEPHDQDHGMARELARMVLPANIYTEWYWKIDLHNLLHFLSLRADPHAQKEIRAYASQIAELVRLWVPYSFEAFEDYVQGAETFSRQEVQALREWIKVIGEGIENRNINGILPAPVPIGLSERERREFEAKLGIEE